MIRSAQRRETGSEARAVVAWRRQRLSAAGFSLPLAHALARDRRVDVHALLDLAALAARILAPLEEEVEVA